MSFALLFTTDESTGDSGGGGGIFVGITLGVFASAKKEMACSCSLKHVEDELVFNCDNNDESFCPSSVVFRDDLLVVDGETFFDVFEFRRFGFSRFDVC